MAHFVRAPPKKQIDPNWLHRKQHNGPTAQDLLPLVTPDPLVRLSASFGGGGGAASGGASGLIAGHDKDTLLPQFSLGCPVDRAFGGGSAAEEWAERGAMQAALMLDLVTI